MPSRLSAMTRSLIAGTLCAAARPERRAKAKELAAAYDISPSQVYRIARLGGVKRKRKAVHPDYRDWVPVAVQWSHRAPEPVPLDQAIRGAIEDGQLPPEAGQMPIATARKICRELGLVAREKRTHRLHSAWPMQAVQLDASTSKFLTVDGPAAGDATRLRLHRKPTPSAGYKNKPLGPDRLRVEVYGLWDMCTGVVRSRYLTARGETAQDAVEFLCWALSQAHDPRVVLHGVPDDLWIDQGVLLKWAPARDLLERLDHVRVEGDSEPDGVHIVTGPAYQKTRMGGIERSHRTRWARFERALFLRREQTISLGELNARLVEFEVEESGRRLSRTPVDGRELSRSAAWVALTNRRPAGRPLCRLPDNPLKTLAREARRKIDVSGIVRWGGVLYESADWHDRWVLARRAADGGGDLVVVDEATGERRIARRYAPRPYGEVRSAPATPLERLRAEDAPEGERTGADIWAPGPPPKTVPMPARTAAPRALDNPLDGGRCRDMSEALRLFVDFYPHELGAADLARVAELIERGGLRRQAVIDLARELLAAARKQA